jgi:hypothetical protein
VLMLVVCGDPPTAPIVEEIELSVLDTGTTMFFREPIEVTASPRGHLGTVVDATVNWSSKDEAVLSVVPLSTTSARINATGIGTADVEVSAGGYSRVFQVTVLDTVYSVSVAPNAMNLVAGDTISLTATVDPPSALTRVRWTPSAATLQLLSSPDSNTVLVQAVAPGSATMTARAIADTTKGASAAFTTKQGTLLFLQQPSAVMKGAALGPAVAVVVANEFGISSRRTANAITLTLEEGSCSTGATLGGLVSRTISNGVAAFSDLTLDRVSAGCRIVATANPPALAATSVAFDVSPRGCAPIPYTDGVAVSGVIEASDCAVTGPGGTFYTHIYSITVPSTVPIQYWRVHLAAEFSPRLQAYLWPAVGAFRDTAGGTTASQYYMLEPGTYQFRVTSSLPTTTGTYALSSQVGSASAPNAQGLCYFLSSWIKVPTEAGGLSLLGCTLTFTTVARIQPARAFIIYLPANEGVTVRLAVGPVSGSDAYLELFDVTTPGTRNLVTFDNNSGGGESGLNAKATIESAPTNRFIEILAGHLNGSGEPFFISITDR